MEVTVEITVRQIQYGTAEYEEEVRLRDEILRKPIGFTFTKEFLEMDRGDVHFAAFQASEMVGCLLLHPKSETELKMRQVAVATAGQGKGVGRKLVEASEVYARANGYELILLSARDTAVKFYLALGYEIVGDPFTEVGIPHRLMKKSL